MKIITNPDPIVDEVETIEALFEEGMNLLHIRKPNFSREQMKQFVNNIKPVYRKQLVLHSHHELADLFGIKRIHFTEKDRQQISLLLPTFIYSTSVHDIETFNQLEDDFSYAFLSPVFPSISKPGHHSSVNLLQQVRQRTNFTTSLVALGGINTSNIDCLYNWGFDDVALLGAIWQCEYPLKKFKKCQKIARLYSH